MHTRLRAKHVLQLFSALWQGCVSESDSTNSALASSMDRHPSRCLDPPTMMLFMLSVAGQRHLDRIQT